MEEEKIKSRAWIKDAALIFLTIMLILTFFSNTILNRSLPEVAVAQVMSDTIDNKVRINGNIEAKENYDVILDQSRTVESVKVRIGDEVKEGDVLFTFGAGDSDELEAAKEQLRQLQLNYQKALLNSDSPDYEEDQRNILKKEYELIKATDELDKITATPDIDLADLYNRKDTVEKKLDSYEKAYEDLKRRNEYMLLEYATPPKDLDEEELEEWKEDKADWTERYNIQNLNYQNWIADATDELKEITDKITSIETAQKTVQNLSNELEDMNFALAQKQKSEDKASTLQKLDFEEMEYQISKAKELVGELSGTEGASEVKAKVSGTVTSLNVSAGHMAPSGTVLCSIMVPDMGYSLSCKITSDQARYLSVGNSTEFSAWYWGETSTATITRIAPDPASPQTNKIVYFDVVGSVSAGQKVSFAIGERNATYDLVVPNSALRNDTNGNFVLMITAKNSPLGNRYFAKRVDVDILAADDFNSAISGEIEAWESVITTSTNNAPIKHGDQVRLRDVN